MPLSMDPYVREVSFDLLINLVCICFELHRRRRRSLFVIKNWKKSNNNSSNLILSPNTILGMFDPRLYFTLKIL
jgi:hypothetical protein